MYLKVDVDVDVDVNVDEQQAKQWHLPRLLPNILLRLVGRRLEARALTST